MISHASSETRAPGGTDRKAGARKWHACKRLKEGKVSLENFSEAIGTQYVRHGKKQGGGCVGQEGNGIFGLLGSLEPFRSPWREKKTKPNVPTRFAFLCTAPKSEISKKFVNILQNVAEFS